MSTEKTKTASAATVLWRRNIGSFYLMKRTGCTHFRNLWGCPGGKIRFGELTVEAARREVREEAGLDIPASRFKFLQNNDDEDSFLCATYYVDLKPSEIPKNIEPEKHSDWVEMTVEDLKGKSLIPGLKDILAWNF